MSDSTSHLDLLSSSQAQKEVVANVLFDAASPSILFGRRASTTSGLTWGYYGGRLNVGGTPTAISNGTVALTASATNYVEATTAGVVSCNTSGFTGGRLQLYTVVTDGSGVTGYTDYRTSATSAGPIGTGDVVGPASAVNNRVAFFDGTTGKLIKDSGLTLAGSNTGDQTITLTGDVTGTGTGSFATTIANDAVTYAKMQNVSAASKLLGRGGAGGAGDVEEISVGTGLSLSGTTLSATSTGVQLTDDNVFTANQCVQPVTTTTSGSYAADAATSNNFQITMNGNLTLANPTNLVAGMVLNFCLDQDATGGRTITLGNLFKFPSGTVPTYTSTNGKNFLSCYYDGTILRCSGGVGYA